MTKTEAYETGFSEGMSSLESIHQFEKRLDNLWGKDKQDIKNLLIEGFIQAKQTLEIMFDDPDKEIKKIQQWQAAKASSKEIDYER